MVLDTLIEFFAGDGGLWALCLSAFLSATVLPGSSEALLSAAVASDPTFERVVLLTLAARFFNTLGSMTSWAIGRYFPHKTPESAALERLRRYGPPALMLAWVPVIGDVFPLAAGWLKVGFGPALLWTALGKTARYAVLSAALTGFL